MVFCLRSGLSVCFIRENKTGALDVAGLRWWLLCHAPRQLGGTRAAGIRLEHCCATSCFKTPQFVKKKPHTPND